MQRPRTRVEHHVLSPTRSSILLPLLLILGVVVAQIGLAHGLSFVPLGTRAQGTGASVSTALFLLAGYFLGRSSRTPSTGTVWQPVPSGTVLKFTLGLSVVGILGWMGGGLDELLPEVAVGEGGIARAMWATNAVLFPPFLLCAIGAGLGANSGPGTTVSGLVGATCFFILCFLFWELARRLLIDPGGIRTATTVGVGVAALGTGFGLSWARRRLAFVEMALVALISGYTLYLAVAVGPPSLVVAWSLPIEQILLALSIVPTIGLMAVLAVGGSLGYLLFGSGTFDPRFGYEVKVAKRYLQVNLRKAWRGLIIPILIGVSLGAGVLGFGEGGWPGAAAMAIGVWAVAIGVRPALQENRGQSVLLVFGTVGLSILGFALGSYLGWMFAAILSLILAVWGQGRPLESKGRAPPFVGLVTVISVLGVALGVTALIVVLSVMSGFENDLKSKILGAHAHIVVEKYGDDFTEYQAVENQVKEATGVRTASAFVLGDAMMSTDVGLSGALVKGVDPVSEDAVGELRENLQRGRVEYLVEPSKIPGACGKSVLPPRPPKPPATESSTGAAKPVMLSTLALSGAANCTGRTLPGVIIGKELSRALRAYVGDVVKLVSPVSDEIGPLGPTPKLRRFRVAGIFYSGMYEYDAKLAYVSMKQAQKFFGLHNKASGVELKIENIDLSGVVVGELDRRLGGKPYRVKDWREMNKELFSALLLEKIAMFVALTMIIMVASFLIVATLVMIVLQRGREIAILKSVGASSSSIMKVFVLQGVIVGVGGAILGVLAGVGICLLLETVGVRLDERIFYIERLPVNLDWNEVGIIGVSAMVITYLATIYPAITAAMLRPVDGLREE